MVLSFYQWLIRFRDRLAIDDLIVRADISEHRARTLHYVTQTPADFLFFALAYRFARDPKHPHIPFLFDRQRRIAPGYDPSLRFSSLRPMPKDDAQSRIYERSQIGPLQTHAEVFLERYPSFSFERFIDNFVCSEKFSSEHLNRWIYY